jgi:hypothetical protein
MGNADDNRVDEEAMGESDGSGQRRMSMNFE